MTTQDLSGTDVPPEIVKSGDFESTSKHNLNVVYFVPSDLDTLSG